VDLLTTWDTVKRIFWSAEFIAPFATVIEILAFPFLSVETSTFEKLVLFLLQYVALKATLRITKLLDELHGTIAKETTLKTMNDTLNKIQAVGPGCVRRGDLPVSENLHNTLDNAQTEICFSGISMNALCNTELPLLIRKRERGCKIRILLVDPLEIENAAIMTNWSKKASIQQLELSMGRILECQGLENNGGSIEGRLLPSFPGYGLQIIDPEKPLAKIKIEMYTTKGDASDFPNFFVEQKCQNFWFDELKRHFDELWKLSSPLTDDKVRIAQDVKLDILRRLQQGKIRDR
jgi:hypothetical protein